MKIIDCPIIGPRPEQEFSYGGHYHSMPNPDSMDDAAWGAYLYLHDGAPGLVKEWWYHIASGTWFIAERDTRTDTFIRTYLYSEMSSNER